LVPCACGFTRCAGSNECCGNFNNIIAYIFADLQRLAPARGAAFLAGGPSPVPGRCKSYKNKK